MSTKVAIYVYYHARCADRNNRSRIEHAFELFVSSCILHGWELPDVQSYQ